MSDTLSLTPDSVPVPRFQLRVLDQRHDVLACELLISNEVVEKIRLFAASKGLAMEDLVGDAFEDLIEACEHGTVRLAQTIDLVETEG